jgi:hypothetical protein
MISNIMQFSDCSNAVILMNIGKFAVHNKTYMSLFDRLL